MKLTEKQLKAMKADFKNFMFVVWKLLNLPDPTPIQYDIADKLQNGGLKEIIEAFRGIGKSYITAAFTLWCLWKNPDEKIMVVSAGQDRADSFSYFVKQILTICPFLSHLMPRKQEGNRDTQNIFDVYTSKPSGSPSVKSVGITGTLTGSRATIIIADDIEVPNNSMTHGQREKLAQRVEEFISVLIPGGRIVFLGTPQTEMSLYNKLYSMGYNTTIWPARIPSPELASRYGAKLASYIRDMIPHNPVGAPTEPSRFGDEVLIEKASAISKSTFALQFMMDTSLSDGLRNPLNIKDLIIHSCGKQAPVEIKHSNNPLLVLKDLPVMGLANQQYHAPEFVSSVYSDYDYKLMFIDPSGRGADETAYAVLKSLNGNLYLTRSGGFNTGYTEETLKALIMIAKEEGVNKIVIESNFGDGMFTQMLRPFSIKHYPVELEEIRNSKQKELRIIDSLEPLMNQHRLIVDPKVIQDDYDSCIEKYSPDTAADYMLFYQLSRISKDKGGIKHDDRLDALASAVLCFNEMLDIDQELQERKRLEDIIDQELEEFMNSASHGKLHSGNSIKLWDRIKR